MRRVVILYDRLLKAGIKIFGLIIGLKGKAEKVELEAFERIVEELELFAFSLTVYERRRK